MSRTLYVLSVLVLLLMAYLPILGISPAQLQTSDPIPVALDKKMLPNSGPLYGMTNILFEDPGAATILRPAGWKDVRLAQIIGNPSLMPVNALRYRNESGTVRIAVDTDSDGDWNDEQPLVFEKFGDSSFADFSVRVVASEGSQASPAEVAYQIIQTGSYTYARIREYRAGTLQIGDAIFGILLRPQDRNAPFYGPGQSLFFVDLDRNGEIVQYWEERKGGELLPAEQVSLTQPFLLDGRKFIVESLDTTGTRLLLKPSSADTAVSLGFLAPPFEATDLEGRFHRLRDLRGRVVLLEFWSVDCPWADTVRPLINALAEKFKGSDFAALSISREKEPSALREYLKSKPKSTTVLGRDDNVWRIYNPEGMSPLAFVLDRSGVIRLIAPGARSLKALEAAIARLIIPQVSTDKTTGQMGKDIQSSPRHSTSFQETVEQMLDIAGVRMGMLIGEIGSGGGPFTYRLAERVGNKGKIYANDIDRKALDSIKQKGIPNIETVLGDVDDPLFPVLNLDMIIMRSVFHDLEHPLSMLENLKKYLNPGAPTVIIEQLPTANPPYHVMIQEQLLGIIQKSSFELARMETSLPSRWVVYYCRVNQVKEPSVWADWLREFKNEASRRDEWERTPSAYPDKRRIAWERLLDSFRDNNPSTEEDERLRKSIAERIGLMNSQRRQTSAIRERADDRGTHDDATGMRLRTEYKTMEIEEISAIMRRLGFQAGGNGRYPEGGDFQNHFEIRTLAGDDVIIDHATGLMWQRSGSEKPLKYFDALEWTADLNLRAYAGYSDWRIPTIDEVVSLFETKKTNGKLQIDPVFSATQTYVWTGDAPYSGRQWAAVFSSSSLWEELKTNPAWVRAVRSMR